MRGGGAAIPRRKMLRFQSAACFWHAHFSRLPPPQRPQDAQGLPLAQRRRLAAFRQELSSRRLQRTWREFCRRQRSTFSLVQALVGTGVTGAPRGEALLPLLPACPD